MRTDPTSITTAPTASQTSTITSSRTMVTGGAGFIGSHLVDALLQRGHVVTVVDDLSTGSSTNLGAAGGSRLALHRIDVRDGGSVAAVVDATQPEVIFHLAAQVDVRKSVAHPAFDVRTNIEGTVNVLEAARRSSARVINVSTGGAMYGAADVIPTPESVEALPEAPYGQSKLCAERYVGLYGRLFGLRGVTARLGNVYGPRQDPRGEAGVIAIVCGLLARGERPCVYGSGEQTRDYVYVADVIDGLLALLDCPHAQGEFNLGTGQATSVLDVIDALVPFADGDFEPTFAPPRPGEIEHSCLDVTRAATELGWSAQITLNAGLRHTADWTFHEWSYDQRFGHERSPDERSGHELPIHSQSMTDERRA